MSISDRNLYGAAVVGLGATGLALVSAGVAEIASHATHAWALGSSLCGGSGQLSVVELIAADSLHCWGCPVAFTGGLLLLAALGAALKGAGAHGPFASLSDLDGCGAR